MTTVYSNEYTHGLWRMRLKCDYTVTSTNTATTVNASVVLQYKADSAETDTDGYYQFFAQLTNNAKVSSAMTHATIKGTSWQTYSTTVTTSKTYTRTTANQTISLSFWGTAGWTSTLQNTSSETKTVSITVPVLQSYNVSYNANGGSGAPSQQTKYYGIALTLSSTKPTRANCTFQKWNTVSGGTGTNYNPGSSYTANAAATLYAQWKYNHTAPTITNLVVKRCNSDGTDNEEGESCKVEAAYSIDTKVVSTASIASYTVKVGFNDAVTTTVSGGTSSGTISYVYNSSTLSIADPYYVTLTVTDDVTDIVSGSVGYSSSNTAILSRSFFTMDFKEGGHGVGIGKASTVDNLLDIGMPTRFSNAIYWKEDGYGDKFAIVPSFNGADDANLLKIQSAVGAAGTDPELSDKFAIAGSTGNAFFYGRLVNVQHGVANTDSMFVAKRTDTGTSVGFGIGSDGVNHGVYSHKLNNWIIYADAANVWVNKTINRNIGASGVSYIDGAKGNSALYLKKNTGSYWYPAVTFDTAAGGSWSIGNYNTEQLELVYATKAYRDASNNNIPGHIYLSAPPAARNWYVARILYDNNTGTTGTVSLAETAANFAFMFIGYRNENSHYSGIFVRTPNGKTVCLANSLYDGSTWGTRAGWCAISGTSITRSKNHLVWVSPSAYGTSENSAKIYITHVIGFA